VPKRVALLVPSLVAGGAERGAIFVGRVLEQAGYRVELVAAVSKGALLDEPWARAHLVELHARAELLALPGWLRYLDAARPALAISFVHSANLVSGLGGKMRPRIPFIVSLRNSLVLPRREQWWVRRWLGLGLERRLYVRASFVQAVSRELYDQAATLLAVPPERLWLTYNSAQLSGEAPAPPALGDGERIASLAPYLVSAGRLVPVKGFDRVIRAFAAARLPEPWKLVIVGEGPLRGELEALARVEGVGPRVIFAGYRDPLLPWLAGARGFVFGSHGEGLPRVLLEALDARLPIAACRAPGVDEVLGGGGFGRLLPADDSASLAQAMRDIAQGVLAAPPPDALATHLARFSPEAVGASYLAMVHEAIGAP